MAGPKRQGELFSGDGVPDGTRAINGRCLVRTEGGHRVILVAGVLWSQHSVGDRMAEAHAMVSLVDQGWADQIEVAQAFGCSTRTLRRHQRRFEEGGLSALGRCSGYPTGRPRLPPTRTRLLGRLKAEGTAHREIARRLGVSAKAVRKLLRRQGWKPSASRQVALPLDAGGGDPNLSGLTAPLVAAAPGAAVTDGDPNLSGLAVLPVAAAPAAAIEGADPNVSGPVIAPDPLDAPASFDTDPADRRVDRLLAYLGFLDDAAPLFRPGTRVPRAGVLLALPAILDSGVVEIARRTYGSIGPAFYGLRTSIVAFLLMALLRIKRPEAVKEHSPEDLGRLLGLDRAPEVKTLRRKLTRLAAHGCATQFGRALAEHRVKSVGAALGFLYVDGHVRVYHGKHTLPKTHVARMRLALPATSDYWVNDSKGDPLFVITAKANAGMVKMLPPVLAEVRALVGERRVTIVFDRGGYSPKLFQSVLAQGFDILTYRKGRSRRVPKKNFQTVEATIEGKTVSYRLADQNVKLLRGKLSLRQVTRLTDDGHQTPILTSLRDLPAVEIAFRMFERWRQENFFKYLREEYALDVLVDYEVVPDDPTREVPNPVRAAADARLRVARAELEKLRADYGVEAFNNDERIRPTSRGFKIANGALGKRLREARLRVASLSFRRNKIPTRVPVQTVCGDAEVIQLAPEKKHLTNLLKMVAYQVESDLVRLITPHYRRAADEGRTLIQSILAAPADITTIGDELHIHVAPLSSPHRTRALAALCEELDRKNTTFPGTRLRLRYAVATDD